MNANIKVYRNTLYIKLDGELDQHTVLSLRYKITELMGKYRIKNMILDFKKLTFMDSSGIGIILSKYRELKAVDGKIVLCELNNEIKKVVKLSGLSRICVLKETVDQANYYLGVE